MALVKCTKQVHDHVINQIQKLFADRLTEAYKLQNVTEEEVAEAVYRMTHTPARLEAIKDLESMFKGCKISTESSEFNFVVATSPQNKNVIRSIWGKFKPPKQMLSDFNHTYGLSPKIYAPTPEIATEVEAAHARRDAVAKDQEEFKQAFEAAWTKVKSVNELVKLWPAASDLLTQDIIERLNRKMGPREKQVAAFDASELNVHLLKAKVAK